MCVCVCSVCVCVRVYCVVCVRVCVCAHARVWRASITYVVCCILMSFLCVLLMLCSFKCSAYA